MSLLAEEEAVLALVAMSLRAGGGSQIGGARQEEYETVVSDGRNLGALQSPTDTLPNLPTTRESWEKLCDLVQRHQLASLVAGPLMHAETPDEFLQPIVAEGRRVCLRYYRLAWDTRVLCDLLGSEGMKPLVYKGCAAASYYRVPEIRKAGDIDIFVGEADVRRAADMLENAGFEREPEYVSSHHICFTTQRGFEIELHRHLTKPFNNQNVDDAIKEAEAAMYGQKRMVSALPGVEVPTMEEAELAFSLVIHMVQHQLRGGFGLRLLVDWVAFLNAEHEASQMERLNSYLEEAGLMRFISVVIACCERWLGLTHEKCAALRLVSVNDELVEQFMRDVISAGDFGKSIDTAIAAPDKASLWGFAREFHHQMLLRHPCASKVVPIWPALWANTLFQFVRNNRKLRHISTIEVLKTAAKRGKAIDGLRLFEREEDDR